MFRLAPVSLLLFVQFLSAADPKPRLDPDGFPLPAEAVRRFGSAKFLTNRPTRVVYAPDGKVIYTTHSTPAGPGREFSGSVAAWEVATGKRIWVADFDPGWSPLELVADPDGKHVWATAFGPPKQNGFNVTNQQVRQKLLATTGKRVATVELTLAHGSQALHPTGLLAWVRWDAVAGDYALVVLSPDGEKRSQWLPPQDEEVVRLALTADGKIAFALIRRHNGSFLTRAIRTDSGKVVWSAEVSNVSTASALTPTPDGKHLLLRIPSGQFFDEKNRNRTQGTALVVLDAGTGKEVAREPLPVPFYAFTGSGGTAFTQIQFLPGGKEALVQGSNRQSIPLDLKTWKVGAPLDHEAAAGVFAPDGKSYLFASARNLQFFDAATHKPLPWSPPLLSHSPFYPHKSALDFSADGTLLHRRDTASARLAWETGTGKERQWEASRPEQSADGKRSLRRTDGGTWEVVETDGAKGVPLDDSIMGDVPKFTPDGRSVVSIRSDGVRVWDVKAGGKPKSIAATRARPYTGTLDSLRFDAGRARALVPELMPQNDPRQAVSVIGVYDLTQAKRVGELAVVGQLVGWNVTPSGQVIAASSRIAEGARGTIQILRPDESTPRRFDFDHPVSALAISADERTAAVGSASGVHLIDLRTGKVRHTFTGLTRAPESLAFSPSGRHLVSESADGPVLLWDVRGELSPGTEPDAARLGQLWADLGSEDAAKAFDAVRVVAAHPTKALPFLKAKVAEFKPPTAAEIAARVAKLDAKEFAERDTAEKELRAMGAVSHPALKAALAGQPKPEMASRATRLLAVSVTPPALLASRLTEAAEWTEAKELLAEWGKSAWPELAAEAATASKRLKK